MSTESLETELPLWLTFLNTLTNHFRIFQQMLSKYCNLITVDINGKITIIILQYFINLSY